MSKRTVKSLKYFLIAGVIVLAGITFIFYPKKTVAPSGQSPLGGAQPSSSPSTDYQLQTADLSWPSGQTISAKVLMYHHLGEAPANADAIRLGLTVSATNFETQLKFLKDSAYSVVTMADLYRQVAQSNLKPKTAVLTFDDGYADNYSVAWPILQKYGFVGTFFIISGDIGKADYMSSDQIKNLSSSGNEIGSHTVSHPDLATLSVKQAADQLVNSKKTLEDLIAAQVISLCYPSGKYSAAVETQAKSAGYKTAVTTEKGAQFSSNNPLEIPRYRINPTTNLAQLIGER